MKIGLIGASEVGCTLGKYFAERGIEVTGYYSRTFASAQEAAAFTGTKAYEDPAALIEESDALFLTVPDRMITTVYEGLRQYGLAGKMLCHCSGAMTAREAFPAIEQTGASGYSIHPLFPVSSKDESYLELEGAFFCVEGDDAHLSQWKTFLESLHLRVQIIPGDAKVRYHAACAIASNLYCALVQTSVELLEECGFTHALALEALAPLVRSNLQRILQVGPQDALTGPVERNDAGTVKKHLACIPEGTEQALYRAASAKLVEMASRRHPEEDYSALMDGLKGGTDPWPKTQ
jgi:predicted short-subunit dehydrogenase-like oxidoreductase (DUF2520 family)